MIFLATDKFGNTMRFSVLSDHSIVVTVGEDIGTTDFYLSESKAHVLIESLADELGYCELS